MSAKEDIKDRLRRAMAANNMKAVDLCEKTGIPKSAVSYYLAGKSEPKADRVHLISKVLGVSEAWLLGYDVPMERGDEQKKNDKLAELIVKMRADNDFYNVVAALSELPAEQYESIKGLLVAFTQK